MRTSSKRIIAMGVLLLAVCFSPAGNAKGDFIDGMKGYWHFGTDLSSTVGGPALNATVGAGTPDPGTAGGQMGSCLHLYDADNEYIVLPVGYGVSAGTGASLGADFTVSGWYNLQPTPGNTSARYFVWEGSDGYDISYGVRDTDADGDLDDGQAYCQGGAPTNTIFVDAATQFTWHHVLTTYVSNGPSTTITYWIDGVKKSTQTMVQSSATIGSPAINIGRHRSTDAGDRDWDGLLDEVAVWNRALTDEEVETVWTKGLNGQALLPSVLIANPESVTVKEEGATSASYTIKLVREPNTPSVTVTATRQNGQITVNGGTSVTLTFTNANWNTPQTITVAAVDDDLMEGNHRTSVGYSLASGDSFFNGAYADPMPVNIIDNDTPGVTITESGGSTVVTEGGATDSLTVVLDAEPNQGMGNDGKVYITITVADVVDETTVNGGGAITLTFTPTNWKTAQTVTVAAVNDAQVEGNHVSQLIFTLASQDVGYVPGWPGFPVSVPTIWVAVTDNDGAAQQEAARWEFDTTNVNLSARTVNDSVGDFDATLDYDSDYKVPALFEKAGTGYHYLETNGPDDPNWIIEVFERSDKWHYLPQLAITLEAWVAPDDATAYYEGIINCMQDTGAFERGWWLGNSGDQFGFGLSTASSLGYIWSTTHYASGQWHHVAATYDGTTVRLYVDGLEESNSTTRSGPINYSDAAFVLSAYLDDNEKYTFEGRLQEVRMYNYVLDAAMIMSNYVAMPPGSMTTITESGGSTAVSEEGPTSDSYTVVLKAVPSASVLITVEPAADLNVGAGAGNPKTLTFTTGNWNTAQTVTVTAVDDEELEGDEVITIKHTISSAGDADYNRSGVRNVYVNVADNECGLWGFWPVDINEDCRVDLFDYAEFAISWAECTQPYAPGCEPYFGEGLVAYWSFDDDFSASDPAYNATPVNGASIVPGGKMGGAANLDLAQLQYATTAASPFTQGSYTYAAWYYLDVADITGTNRYCILEASNGTTYPASYELAEVGGVDVGRVFTDTSLVAPSFSFSANGNQTWHHVAVTYDASTGVCQGYLDGAYVGQMTAAGVLDPSTYLVIGGHRAYTTRNWHGLIDEVAVWNRALNAGSIYALWNNGNGRKPLN